MNKKHISLLTILCFTASFSVVSTTGCTTGGKNSKSWHNMPMGFVAPPARSTTDYAASQKKSANDEALKDRPVLRTLHSISDALTPETRVVKEIDPISLQNNSKIEDPSLYVLAGRMATGKKQYDVAEAHFQDALKLEKTNTQALLSYGQLLTIQGKFDQAVQVYRTGIENGNEELSLASEIGYCLLMKGETKRSLKILDALVQQEPDNDVFRQQLAFALVSDGEHQAAVEQLAAVMDEANAWTRVGKIQVEMGQRDRALASFKQAALLDESSAEARTMVASLSPLANQSARHVSIPKVSEQPVQATSVLVPQSTTELLPSTSGDEMAAAKQETTQAFPTQAKARQPSNSHLKSTSVMRVGNFSQFGPDANGLLDIEQSAMSSTGSYKFNPPVTEDTVSAARSSLSQEAFDHRREAEKQAAIDQQIRMINERVAQAEKGGSGGFFKPRSVPAKSLGIFSRQDTVEKSDDESKPEMSAGLRAMLR